MTTRPSQVTTSGIEVHFNRLREPLGVIRTESGNVIDSGGASVPGKSDTINVYNGKLIPYSLGDGINYYYKPEQLVYAPESVRNKYIMSGWNPATVLLANQSIRPIINAASESINIDPGSAGNMYQVVLAVCILSFIKPGSDIWIPEFEYVTREAGLSKNTLIIVPGFKQSYDDAVKFAYGAKPTVCSLSELVSAVDVKSLQFYEKCEVINRCIKNVFYNSNFTILPVFTPKDIVLNWDLISWRDLTDCKEYQLTEIPTPVVKLPLPIGACQLTITGSNVNINKDPKSGTSVGKLNKGDVVNQIGNEKNGFIPVSSTNKIGWVSSSYLNLDDSAYSSLSNKTDVSPLVEATGLVESNTGGTQVLPVPPETDKSSTDQTKIDTLDNKKMSTTTKVAIGVGVLVALVAGTVIITKIRNRKKS